MPRKLRPFETKYHFRIIALIILVAIVFIAAIMRAFQFQIVDGEAHYKSSLRNSKTTISVMAARGDIVDRKGVPLTHNEAIFNVEFDQAFFIPGSENEIIYNLIRLMEKNSYNWIDELPISPYTPYEFTKDSDSDVARLKAKIDVNDYATANDCMENMYRDFNIKKYETEEEKCTHCGDDFDECTFEGYSEIYARKILGVRYSMLLADFSTRNRYVFAEDISPEIVALIREFSDDYRGVFVVERTKRTYLSGDVASHLIGTIGPIYEDEKEDYLFKGTDYYYDDLIGKSGIEKACEAELKGKNGEILVTFDSDKNIIDSIETASPIAGKTIQLTLNYEFQKQLQQLVADYIQNFNETNDDDKIATAASVVVLDAKTGDMLASVSYPYYDINDYINNYSEVLNAEGNPLNNRALNGLYRPGSTFKPVVAAAALNQNLVEPDTGIFCTGRYNYWEDISFGCLSINHGRENLNVSEALQHSCNIFFYDTGRRLEIETINKYSEFLGLGVDTGLEIPSEIGNLSSREFSESHNMRWEAANVVQAAIGQMDTAVTPLQMAVEAMTIANKGTRYNVNLIDAILENDGETVYFDKEPTVASNFDMSDEDYVAISSGMTLASHAVGAPNQLTDLGYDVAIKTGTPQVTVEQTNSAFVAFSPVENPEIAISCMVEGGDSTAGLVRQIIDLYEKTK